MTAASYGYGYYIFTLLQICALLKQRDAENQDNVSKLEFCNGIKDETITHINTFANKCC